MVLIGNVQEINEVKKHFASLETKGLIKSWEIPYENLLTRLTAAVFFLTPSDNSKLAELWSELGKHPMFTCRENTEKHLSSLEWRVEFNKGFEL